MSSLPYDASIFMISCCLSLFLGATVSQNWEHKTFCKCLIKIFFIPYMPSYFYILARLPFIVNIGRVILCHISNPRVI